MKPSEALQRHRQEILQIVQDNRALNPKVFGSVLYGEDQEDSDLDLLVEPTTETSLLDIARIKRLLQSLMGIPVDVLTPNALPASFRHEVLKEARPL